MVFGPLHFWGSMRRVVLSSCWFLLRDCCGCFFLGGNDAKCDLICACFFFQMGWEKKTTTTYLGFV